MPILFVGSTRSEIDTIMEDTTTTTFFDSAYQSQGLVGPTEDTVNTILFPLQATVTGSLWLHYRYFHNRNSASGMGNADGQQMTFWDANNVLIGTVNMLDGRTRVEVNGDSVVNGAYWTWPAVGAPTLTFDVRVQVTASDITMEYYVNGALVSSATAVNTVGAKTGVRLVMLDHNDIMGTNGATAGIGMSEVIITQDEPTIGWRLATLRPDGAGTYGAWGGSWTHVLNPDDGLFLLAAETGLRESWSLGNYNGPATNAAVRGVFMSARADRGPTGPQTVQGFLRLSGVDYDGTPQAALRNRVLLWEWANNPATGLPWDSAVFNAMEAGIRSST